MLAVIRNCSALYQSIVYTIKSYYYDNIIAINDQIQLHTDICS